MNEAGVSDDVGMSGGATEVLGALKAALPELEDILGGPLDVARPPLVWPVEASAGEIKEIVLRVARSIGRTTGMATLLVSNIEVGAFEDDDHEEPQVPPVGRYVGLSIKVPTVEPGSDGLILDLGDYAYRRALDDEVAIVVYLSAAEG